LRFSEKAAQQIARSFRGRVEFDFLHFGNVPAIRDDNAVNWSSRRDRNIVHDSISGVAQKLETGNKSKIEFVSGKFTAKRRWMIEVHLVFPSSNERTGVEIFDAADAWGFQNE
jgi:hypothetical protein